MKANGRILVVDDDSASRLELAALLKREGYTTETAADGFKALPKVEEWGPDLVLTDLHMPAMTGIELMTHIHQRDPEIPVIVMTAYAAVDTAISALKQGAADYLTKPLRIEELLLMLERAMERRRLRAETARLRARIAERDRIGGMVGKSAAMQQVYETVMQVAPTRASVLITGESGTGKELIAAAIHEHSTRSQGPFVALHCAALSETLLESELFGHERGAFTGAVQRRDGRFQQANGGTLFLDEIGEISLATQVKLLRFLQEHEYQRVGGNQTIKVDVRVVAATHRDLEARIRAGNFREDLYYRLNVVTIEVPALRDRREDIPLLAMHFLRRSATENGKAVSGFTVEALEALMAYAWPGNVRELENAVARAVIVCRGDQVRPEDLSRTLSQKGDSRPQAPPIPGSTLADLERYAIGQTLIHTGGSTSKAAEMLGISLRKLQYRLKEYMAAGTGEGGAPALPEAEREKLRALPDRPTTGGRADAETDGGEPGDA